MTGSPKNTPAFSRCPTDSSNDEELDHALLTPPDRTSYTHRVVAQGQLVPAHSPIDEFIGTPFSTSNLFEYPFNPGDSPPKGSKAISIATTNSSAQYTTHTSTGSGSPSSPYYTRALRNSSRRVIFSDFFSLLAIRIRLILPFLWLKEPDTRHRLPIYIISYLVQKDLTFVFLAVLSYV
ncbi:hypothetical protein OPQ81_002015 [Rhizoctonia solani]|nr:hypothetical protein OPQ81_002015 [Rhizoctonia solani]